MLYDAKKWDVPITAPAKKLKGWQKVLLGAADLIELGGWARGQLKNQWGEYCALGGIIYTRGSLFSKWRAYRKLRKAVGGKVIPWNDIWTTNKTMVVETLRKTAYGLGRPPHRS